MSQSVDWLFVFDADQDFAREGAESWKQLLAYKGGRVDLFAETLHGKLFTSEKAASSIQRYDALVNVLKAKYGNRFRLDKTTPSGVPLEIYLSLSDKPLEYHSFVVGSFFQQGANGHYYEIVRLSNSDGIIAAYEPNEYFIHELFLNICLGLNPLSGSAEETASRPEHRPYQDRAEYYRNPYFFGMEPSFGPDMDYGKFDLSFLNDSGIAAKLAEFERALPRGELVELLRKHSAQVVESSDGGVGVVKGWLYSAHPRYFVREELRARGVSIPDGVAELEARKYNIVGRGIMK